MTAVPGPGAQVVATIPGGPVLVRGAHEVTDDDGTPHPVTRPVVAICRCGLSQRAPWCDATHKAVPPATTGSGEAGERA